MLVFVFCDVFLYNPFTPSGFIFNYLIFYNNFTPPGGFFNPEGMTVL
jgi:hypothetical protein